MSDRNALLMGIGLGMTAAYLLDPAHGKKRRSAVRTKANQAVRIGRETLHQNERKLRRVRAAVGRVVSHPRAVHVSAEQGIVTLRGAILEREVARLLRETRRVRGVQAVINHLEPHATVDDVPALQDE